MCLRDGGVFVWPQAFLCFTRRRLSTLFKKNEATLKGVVRSNPKIPPGRRAPSPTPSLSPCRASPRSLTSQPTASRWATAIWNLFCLPKKNHFFFYCFICYFLFPPTFCFCFPSLGPSPALPRGCRHTVVFWGVWVSSHRNWPSHCFRRAKYVPSACAKPPGDSWQVRAFLSISLSQINYEPPLTFGFCLPWKRVPDPSDAQHIYLLWWKLDILEDRHRMLWYVLKFLPYIKFCILQNQS